MSEHTPDCADCACLFPCCTADQARWVKPCPLHQSAPTLLEALEGVIRWVHDTHGKSHEFPQAEIAIRLAKQG